MTRHTHLSTLIVAALAVTAVTPSTAHAAPPPPVVRTLDAPWGGSADFSKCDPTDPSVICSATSWGDGKTGLLGVEAELAPRDETSAAAARAVGQRDVRSSFRLRSPVSALRITFTMHVHSATATGDTAPLLRATHSRVYVRGAAIHTACDACYRLVATQIASSQPVTDAVPSTVEDETFTYSLEMRNSDGLDVPAGMVVVQPLLYADVESFKDRLATGPAVAQAEAHAERVVVEALP